MVAVAVILVGYALYAILGSVGDEVAELAAYRTYMDSETSKLFKIELKEGEKRAIPLENPSTGKNTLYPTEVCFKNECLEAGGTHVIMNELLGKTEKTYCPKCGALVVFHNPGPRKDYEDPEIQEILRQAAENKGD
ncbi:MAG: hypothetical protein DHS20C16_16510 [Phycisphaerae bacterium]|nr:MAG: hypothetical protein DHS20C16_16510 [Phycisphaerae bacterium]